MGVLIKDIEKPKSCYAVIDGESKYCQFVNKDDDCILQLKKGLVTWKEQYSECPLAEKPEPCEDVINRQQAIKAIEESKLEVWLNDYDHDDGYNEGLETAIEEIKNLPSAHPEYTDEQIQKMQDLESTEIEKAYQIGYEEGKKDAQPDLPIKEKCAYCPHCENCDVNDDLSIAQPEQQNARIFQEIVVEYPSYNTYPEYEGKPYFSIKYTEDGQDFIGYGTYKPEVLSEYLKEYFMSSEQPERKRGEWVDYTEDGYLECPFCGSTTNCEDNREELHYCFSCGAELR